MFSIINLSVNANVDRGLWWALLLNQNEWRFGCGIRTVCLVQAAVKKPVQMSLKSSIALMNLKHTIPADQMQGWRKRCQQQSIDTKLFHYHEMQSHGHECGCCRNRSMVQHAPAEAHRRSADWAQAHGSGL